MNKKNEEPMKEIGSPMMSVCSTSMHGDIVIPNLSRRRDVDEVENVEWSDKVDEVSFWSYHSPQSTDKDT